MVMLGTNRPSMTATWSWSAPPASTRAMSWPRAAKSAERIEGAILITALDPVRCRFPRNLVAELALDVHRALAPLEEERGEGMPQRVRREVEPRGLEGPCELLEVIRRFLRDLGLAIGDHRSDCSRHHREQRGD